MQNSGQQIRRKNAGIMPKKQKNGAKFEEKRIKRCNLEKSGQEITEKLQIAESTVKTQRQRAKQYLRKRLKNLYTLVIFLFFE